ncbi:hypothetical protein N7491_009269 [Penicillium cf. griseofulvum]|nr:hypothetical protein N7491_009269 [Penicillium cf. griseofulvum]
MDFDHLAEKKQGQKAAAWLKFWLSRSPEILSMQLAKQHRPGETIYDYKNKVLLATRRIVEGNPSLVVCSWISQRNSAPSTPENHFGYIVTTLRPSNVLIDLDTSGVSGIIDWEFTYAEPAEFTWWLLLQNSEDWEGDLNLFLTQYSPKLRAFLEDLSEHEKQLLLSEPQRLSPRMQDSMATGLLGVCLAARYSSMFDEIYWTFIDHRYYEAFTSLDDRMQLLDQEQLQEMNELVRIKASQG